MGAWHLVARRSGRRRSARDNRRHFWARGVWGGASHRGFRSRPVRRDSVSSHLLRHSCALLRGSQRCASPHPATPPVSGAQRSTAMPRHPVRHRRTILRAPFDLHSLCIRAATALRGTDRSNRRREARRADGRRQWLADPPRLRSCHCFRALHFSPRRICRNSRACAQAPRTGRGAHGLR